MSARASGALALVAILGTTALGCMNRSGYRVDGLQHDKVEDRVDGRWFRRTIVNKDGGIVAIELVYCPIMPDTETVCRTGIVWRSRESKLYDVVPKTK